MGRGSRTTIGTHRELATFQGSRQNHSAIVWKTWLHDASLGPRNGMHCPFCWPGKLNGSRNESALQPRPSRRYHPPSIRACLDADHMHLIFLIVGGVVDSTRPVFGQGIAGVRIPPDESMSGTFLEVKSMIDVSYREKLLGWDSIHRRWCSGQHIPTGRWRARVRIPPDD